MTTNHPAGVTAAAATILIWLLRLAGVDVTPEVAAAVVGVGTALVAAVAPKIGVRGVLASRPTGVAAMAVTVIVWIATLLNVDLSPEVAAALVGVVAGIVSSNNPRDPTAP